MKKEEREKLLEELSSVHSSLHDIGRVSGNGDVVCLMSDAMLIVEKAESILQTRSITFEGTKEEIANLKALIEQGHNQLPVITKES